MRKFHKEAREFFEEAHELVLKGRGQVREGN
jgi:hypothetical protein